MGQDDYFQQIEILRRENERLLRELETKHVGDREQQIGNSTNTIPQAPADAVMPSAAPPVRGLVEQEQTSYPVSDPAMNLTRRVDGTTVELTNAVAGSADQVAGQMQDDNQVRAAELRQLLETLTTETETPNRPVEQGLISETRCPQPG